MDIQVTISDDKFGYSFAYSAEIDAVLEESFAPLNRSDDLMISSIMGDATDAEAEVVLKMRSDAVRIISEAISEGLVKEMKKHDTINGYKVVKDDQAR